MLKRIFDIVIASVGLFITLPLLLISAFLIWCDDKQNPFYLSQRVGRYERSFTMYKLRTMRCNDQANIRYITSAKDERITRVGKFMRRYKLDELPQLLNVLKGDMSLVGPRPRMRPEVNEYTETERHIFNARPGLTDIATILFSIEEYKSLKKVDNPILTYHQVIRPWKGFLGLFYIKHRSLFLDIRIIFLTVLVIFHHKLAIRLLAKLLHTMGASDEVVKIIQNWNKLSTVLPPSINNNVTSLNYSR